MKKINLCWISLLFLLVTSTIKAQNTYLKFKNNILNNRVYNFKDALTMQTFINDTIKNLELNGYLYAENNLEKIDSTYILEIITNDKINSIKFENVTFKDDFNYLQSTKNKTIKFIELTQTLDTIINRLENDGYGTSKITLENHAIKNDTLFVDLIVSDDYKRKINEINIIGYDKFPKGVFKNLSKKYKNKEFSNNYITKLNKELESLAFISITKPTEILFENDKTKIYIYLEKKKTNNFDGFVGFGTDDLGKLRFNGLVDVKLNNILNKAERTQISWVTSGNKQSKFNLGTEIPYLLKSNFGIKLAIENIKQDSTFQSTNTVLGIGYFKDYDTRIYFNRSVKNSVSIQNNAFQYKNYKSIFYTINFIKEIKDQYYPDLFQNTFNFNLNIGIGARDNQKNQKIIENIIDYSYYLNQKNALYFQNISKYLASETYYNNELFRIGGIKNLRGFNENSLQGNFFSSTFIEYRYIINSHLYVHTISDFAIIKDDLNKIKTSTYTLGAGLGLLTKNGIFKIIYANGNNSEDPIKLKNSLFHLSINTNF